MMARKPKPDLDAFPDGSETAAQTVMPRERGDDRAQRNEKPAVCELAPFVAFTEWTTPVDEEDHADL